jgi:hypothetical protein
VLLLVDHWINWLIPITLKLNVARRFLANCRVLAFCRQLQKNYQKIKITSSSNWLRTINLSFIFKTKVVSVIWFAF